MAKALYPGTFDPITLGHIDIIERALHLFDEVTIAIATSASKKPIFTLEERIDHIERIFEGNKKVKAIGFTGLVVDLAKEQEIDAVFWNRCYEPTSLAQERSIARNLEQFGVGANSFNGSALWEPWEVLKGDGSPYKVFTPFFRRGCLSRPLPDEPVGEMASIKLSDLVESTMSLEDINLLPSVDWDSGLQERWDVSEAGAHQNLNEFLENKFRKFAN